MKARGIFLLFLLSSIGIISLYLYIFAKPLHLKKLERERIARIQKVCMKKYPRRRDSMVLQRDAFEANQKIQILLSQKPIDFGPSSISLDNNVTQYINQNRVTLKDIIDILKNLNEDVVVSIAAHTDKNGSAKKNLQLSQERADLLKSYISSRADITFISSIGYGEELPLVKNKKNLPNRRIEISLKRIKR